MKHIIIFFITVCFGVIICSCSSGPASRDIKFSTIAVSSDSSTLYVLDPSSNAAPYMGIAFTPISSQGIRDLRQESEGLSYVTNYNPRFEVTCYIHSRDGIYRNLPSDAYPYLGDYHNMGTNQIWLNAQSDRGVWWNIWLSSASTASLLNKAPKPDSFIRFWSKPDSVIVHYREPRKLEPIHIYHGP